VLVVEDDDDLRTNYTEVLLELPGVVPHPAGTLHEARKIVSALHCQAAILDMRLPDGRGDTLGKELIDRGTHVVYVTGYAEDLDHATDVVLPKPVSGERIVDVVRNVVPGPQADER
jgi:DNA-binding NtrC family response regulator